MADKKSSRLNKIGAALLALGEGRRDVSSGAAPLPLYNHEAHIHLPRHRNAVPAEAPDDNARRRRTG